VEEVGHLTPVEVTGVITVEEQDGDRVMCLAGEIDVMVVDAFEAGPGLAPTPVDVIDAGQVTFIGSTGVQLLLRWAQRAEEAGRPIVLRRSSPALDLVLRVTGLGEQLNSPSDRAAMD
jgi:anti-anti-sigma factor